jgi:glycosyltransferase involved in cell wall biosynthesis
MGGIGEVVSHLHSALLDAGHDSRVWTAGRSPSDARVERIAARPLAFVLRLIGRAVALRDFDVVHCHHGDALGLVAAARIRAPRTAVLVTYHVGHREMGRAWRSYAVGGRRFSTGLAGFVYRNLTARVHRATDACMRRLADGTSFISRSAARDQLGERAAQAAEVVYNAIPEPASPDVSRRIEPVELLYVGTGGARKRVRVLPEVLRRVREHRPAAALRIIGLTREEEPGLCRDFEALGLASAVRFEGRLASRELADYYRTARLVVLPSIYEGLPMVVLEAMACGTPCVATRVSGHPEAIDDRVNGRLVEPDDPEAMAAACVEILSDPSLRERYARAGLRRIAERFAIERQRDAYLAIYRGLAQRRAAVRP